MLVIASLLSGLVFGAGLLISGMVKPTKVLGFLDIFGAWDPSLAVVMVAALAVLVPGFRLAIGRSRPLLDTHSFWPALESLATLSPGIIAFVAAMTGGMALHGVWQKLQPKLRNEAAVANADG